MIKPLKNAFLSMFITAIFTHNSFFCTEPPENTASLIDNLTNFICGKFLENPFDSSGMATLQWKEYTEKKRICAIWCERNLKNFPKAPISHASQEEMRKKFNEYLAREAHRRARAGEISLETGMRPVNLGPRFKPVGINRDQPTTNENQRPKGLPCCCVS